MIVSTSLIRSCNIVIFIYLFLVFNRVSPIWIGSVELVELGYNNNNNNNNIFYSTIVQTSLCFSSNIFFSMPTSRLMQYNN